MRTLASMDVHGKRALVRVDFNVPLGERGEVLDDARIRAALPTLRHLLERDCACVLITHLGRPNGEPVSHLRLAPVADRLSELLDGHDVRRCDEVIGERARTAARELGRGEILMLENLRFHPGEKANDAAFAAELANLGDIYVNDAFAACHRKHASVYTVPRRFPKEARAVGLLVEREVDALHRFLSEPERPFVAIFGGAKVSDKLDALEALLDRADRILVGGAMTYTFMKARGQEVGNSKVAAEQVDAVRKMLDRAGDKLVLPTDHVASGGPKKAPHVVVGTIPVGCSGFDIGPETASRFAQHIQTAGTVLWNGPMGKIEDKDFLAGTRAIAETMARSNAITVVGGGETGQAVHRLRLADQMTHLSTGGGAFLAYVAHGTLPGLQAIEEG